MESASPQYRLEPEAPAHSAGLQSDTFAWLLTCSAVALSAAVPVVHAWIAERLGPTLAYRAGTLILLLSTIVSIWAWPRSSIPLSGKRPGPVRASIAAVIGLGLCYWVASRLLPVIFSGPISAQRGDMLVVIEAGVKEFLAGRTPYRIYQVPWDVPLPYGPTLWAPYIVPVVARADVRLVTLSGYLFVIGACVAAACIRIDRRRVINIAPVCVALLAAILAVHPDISRFYPIAHTPVYWPLLVVFCLLLRLDRWVAAAAVLGLLVSARSTMISVVPIFLTAAYHRQILSRYLVAALLLMSVGPFLPFFLRDPHAVWYAMVGSYAHTMKGFVWTQTTGALTTYGLTAVLLARGLQSYVEIAQVASLAVVYLIAWRPLARHRPPEPWMAMALLVFSMTTLWPVLYIYFDVWVLSIAALMASLAASADSKRLQHSVVLLLMAAGIAVGGIVAAAAARPGSSYTIDVGGTAASSLTGGGFGRDEPSYEDSREFVWVNDTTARVRLPRAGWTSADIQIDIRPFEPVAGLRQTVLASLNGKSIGVGRLRSGWQTVTFHAPVRHWNYGFNVLDLNFAYAMPDPASGRNLSVGIDKIEVR